MKKILKTILIIFVTLAFFVFLSPTSYNFAFAATTNNYVFEYAGNYYYYKEPKNTKTIKNKIETKYNISKTQLVNKILSMGLDLKTAINYAFDGFSTFVNDLSNTIEYDAINASAYIDKNCKINFKNAKNGVKIDKNQLYLQFFENFVNGKITHIKTSSYLPKISDSDCKNHYKLAGKFSTNYASSSAGRKNNIKVASSAINNTFIKPGETISFNALTGERNQKSGYKQAKIIVDGKYIDGFGGGVCQVSTTLYNACLLAGLDISEVHSHTLVPSYISPCFDAMVSANTSDLKITNNTGADYLISARADGNNLTICVYGSQPKYRVVTRSQKYEDIPAGDDIIETSAPTEEYPCGEYKISGSLDGLKAYGFLDYYDGDKLVKSVKIRSSVYSPKKGVTLVVK